MARNIEVRVLGRIYWILIIIIFTAAGSLMTDYRLRWPIMLLSLLPLPLISSRFEKITFNGRLIARRGPFAFLEWIVSGKRQELETDCVEMVTTEAIRSRRGLRQVKYIYKITMGGGGVQIVIMLPNSRDVGFSELLKEILNSLDESKLDPRTSELRQHLNDARPKDSLIEFAKKLELTEASAEIYRNLPTKLLRQIANSLKLEGCMQQAFQCFSLAYKQDPRNAHLLYEMARFFRSLGAINHPRLLSRSGACLRLAAFLGKNEPRLLERIGETYFERLEYKLAARCFLRALGLDPNLYRANIGLAEIALRDGKLAHVAHFYSAAAYVTKDRAQRDLATREANYYTRLCSDEDYFEAEINRITKLQNFQWARNASALLLFVFWMLALLSGRFSNDLGSLAWSAVLSTSLVWLASVLLSFHYSQRHQ
jgi:tetratricopeptide (TPR) repeat protein